LRKLFFALTLALLCLHLYRTPIYDMDLLGYAGNALLFKTQDVRAIHRAVYAEVRQLPNAKLLMGESGQEQDASRRARAENSGNFAEFLPCFAIRPAYNFLLFVLSPLGIARASLLLSVVSFFLIGWVLFLWTDQAALSLLVMLLPPMLAMGRSTMSDAPAMLCALFGLYLLFVRHATRWGLLVIMLSLFLRTDNIVWIAPVLAVLWWTGELKLTQAFVLGATAVLCVLSINHFAGDYGLGMLYYRNFIGTPLAPAEMTLHVTRAEYLSAFRSGISAALSSYLPAVLILGVLGFRRAPHLVVIGLSGALLHFLVLPNYQERWFLLGYILLTIPALVGSRPGPTRAFADVLRGILSRFDRGDVGSRIGTADGNALIR
jgi:hypothetical protein